MSLNVNCNVTDVFYRYKMPKLLAKVEGKGNGIKTVVVNMSDIAKSINRPPSYPCKYFGCELGAQTQMDHKADRYIVNGAHDAVKLQALVHGFIKKFVLCPGCDNPETVLQVKEKKGVIGQTCKACGHQDVLDMRHKLTTFILKNPPDVDPAHTGASLTKKSKGKKAGGKTNGEEDKESEEDGEEQLKGWSNDVPATKQVADDDWSVDVSDAAVKLRQAQLADGVKGLTINEDLEKSEKERLDLMYQYVLQRRDTGRMLGHEKALCAEAERLDVRDKAVLVFCELLFNDNVLNQIGQYRTLLLRFTHDNKKAQKYLIGGLEQLVNIYKNQLLSKVPIIFKKLYDGDILDEDVLLEWAQKSSRKYVSRELSDEIHARAAPFISWLQEAEEESDSEEDEDEVEITYDDRARDIMEKRADVAVRSPASNKLNTVSQSTTDADDIDIDNI